MIFDRLFFIGYQSLGDTFIHNGIAHYYGDRCRELHIPTQPCYYETTRCLYQDWPNIKVVSVHPNYEPQYISDSGLSQIKRRMLNYTVINGIHIPINFSQQYYDSYNLPFSLRYTNFRLPKHIDDSDELYCSLVTPGEPYVLIHKSSSHYLDGFPIDIEQYRVVNGLPNIKIIYVTLDLDQGNLLKWVTLIRNATEIHCVSSSFWALVDSITSQTQARLFYHDIRKGVVHTINTTWNNRRWIEVPYDQKL